MTDQREIPSKPPWGCKPGYLLSDPDRHLTGIVLCSGQFDIDGHASVFHALVHWSNGKHAVYAIKRSGGEEEVKHGELELKP